MAEHPSVAAGAGYECLAFRTGRAAQQYRAQTTYTFHCRTCDEPLEGEFGPLWFSGAYPVEDTDALREAGWLEMEDAWHCPNCVHQCWETNDGDTVFGSYPCPTCAPEYFAARRNAPQEAPDA